MFLSAYNSTVTFAGMSCRRVATVNTWEKANKAWFLVLPFSF
jgi:hypothetical protein